MTAVPNGSGKRCFVPLAAVVEIWMLAGGPAVICSLLSSKGKRIGDVFAGTVVISERGPKLEPPPAMPPALAWWASSLAAVWAPGPRPAQLARQFLSRAAQLNPQMRGQMADRIAAEVARRFPRHHRRVCRRSTCWLRCWPSGIGVS